MAFSQVFRGKPQLATEYADIRGGLSDAARRTWLIHMIVECGMYHKVAGLIVEK